MNDINNKKPASPAKRGAGHSEAALDLAYILSVLWKRRWFIVTVTVISSVVAAVYAYNKPSLYQISAQVACVNTSYDEDGKPIYALLPHEIAEWFSAKSYANVFENDNEPTPVISARVIPKTKSIKISLYSKNADEGKKSLDKVINAITDGSFVYFEKKLHDDRTAMEQQLHASEINIKRLELERHRIDSSERAKLDNKIENSEKTLALLTDNLEIIQRRKMDLENSLKMDHHSKACNNGRFETQKDMHALFVEENDTRIKIEHYKMQLANYFLDRDELLLSRNKDIELALEKSRSIFETIKNKMANLSIVEVVAPPIRSKKPVGSSKAEIIATGLFLGLALSCLVSFLWQFIASNKDWIKGKK